MNAREEFAAALKDLKGIGTAPPDSSPEASPALKRPRRRCVTARHCMNLEFALRMCRERIAHLEATVIKLASGRKCSLRRVREMLVAWRRIERLEVENDKLRSQAGIRSKLKPANAKQQSNNHKETA